MRKESAKWEYRGRGDEEEGEEGGGHFQPRSSGVTCIPLFSLSQMRARVRVCVASICQKVHGGVLDAASC